MMRVAGEGTGGGRRPRRRRPGILIASVFVLAAVPIVCFVLLYVLVDAQPDEQATRPTAEATRTGATNPPPQAAAPVADGGSVAWTAVTADTVDSWRIPDHGKDRVGAVLVALDADIRTWRAGDRITLTVPQTGGAWATSIAAVEGAGSNRSYVGRLESGPFPASFVVTVGPRHTFAHLGTPLGSYELTGNTEFAWLSRTVDDWHGDELDYSVSPSPASRNRDG